MKVVELMMREEIPERELFQAAEVASLLKVQPHEIRSWEAEFPQIHAKKNKSGQRIYRRQDVLLFVAIKNLVHEKKLTISGARNMLAQANELGFSPIDDDVAQPAKDFSTSVVDGNSCDRILQVASKILKTDEDDKEYDELTHQIYQQCASDLNSAMQEESKPEEKVASANPVVVQRLSKREFERAVNQLKASKKSLLDVLLALEKFSEATCLVDIHT